MDWSDFGDGSLASQDDQDEVFGLVLWDCCLADSVGGWDLCLVLRLEKSLPYSADSSLVFSGFSILASFSFSISVIEPCIEAITIANPTRTKEAGNTNNGG